MVEISRVNVVASMTVCESVRAGSIPALGTNYAPVTQSVEETGSNPRQCEFESHQEYHNK